MSKTYRDEAVILKKMDLGEADVLLWLLGRESGLVRVVARGSRRMKSRKGGNIELFNEAEVLLAEGRNLDTLVEASALETFEGWREDLDLISLCFYVADVTIMMMPEGEGHPLVFEQLVGFFSWLKHVVVPSALVRWYEVQLLQALGFWSPNILRSESENALELLRRMGMATPRQIAALKLAPALERELERLTRMRLTEVLERDVRTESFVREVGALYGR